MRKHHKATSSLANADWEKEFSTAVWGKVKAQTRARGLRKITRQDMKKSDPRRGIGRPSKYDPRMVREAERLSVYFFSVNDFADFWGVSLETVHEWCAQHEDFARAMKRAFDFEKFCAAFDLEIESLSKQGLD